MARRRYGRNRLAFDRSVRAALQNENLEHRLDAELDAALIASGRGLADHLDDTMSTLVHRMEELAAEADPKQAAQLAKAVENLAQRVDKAIYTTPHLMNVLREMYATPKSRVEAKRTKEKTAPERGESGEGKGSVDRFRAITGGKSG